MLVKWQKYHSYENPKYCFILEISRFICNTKHILLTSHISWMKILYYNVWWWNDVNQLLMQQCRVLLNKQWRVLPEYIVGWKCFIKTCGSQTRPLFWCNDVQHWWKYSWMKMLHQNVWWSKRYQYFIWRQYFGETTSCIVRNVI